MHGALTNAMVMLVQHKGVTFANANPTQAVYTVHEMYKLLADLYP
ncbi:hypothetical protein HanPI659440_Chr14g0567321 [Helianthus annuus]|nr:hypothetical protein HanPI659440_Chr14g0567321 [Helianthus annuus]